MLTLKELVIEILKLSAADLDKPAVAWPPNSCPASSFVKVVGVVLTPHGDPVLSTGKKPA